MNSEVPPEERLIFALDFSDKEKAKGMIKTLGDAVCFYKVGLELLVLSDGAEIVKYLIEKMGKKVFLDLKMFDVPNTIGAAIENVSYSGVTFVTVHGSEDVLKAALSKKRNGLKVLAVTVLTSFDQNDIRQLGFECSIEDLVLLRARRALKLGCDGVVASGREAKMLREKLLDVLPQGRERMIIVTPGIRPAASNNVLGSDYRDDQRRTVDIEEAFQNGADYIVVGRPISRADNPRVAAENIQQRIKAFFERNANTRAGPNEMEGSSVQERPFQPYG